MAPWRGTKGGVYICSTHRRKPGVCTNTLTLPMAKTDDDILSVIEHDFLSPRMIEDLLRLVDSGGAETTGLLRVEKERLETEIQNLVRSVAAGVPGEAVAPEIRKLKGQLAKVEVKLRVPRREPPDLEKLRAALEQRSEQWKRDLRAEPQVARMLLRRLIGPVELWEGDPPDYVRWEAKTDATALLDGQYHDVASPT